MMVLLALEAIKYVDIHGVFFLLFLSVKAQGFAPSPCP